MVVLPAGEYLMGSSADEKESFATERPQHRVTIGYRFAIARSPVTVGNYRQFVEVTRRSHEGGIFYGSGTDWKFDTSKSWCNPGFIRQILSPWLA